jgi:uncharacterized membrane protein
MSPRLAEKVSARRRMYVCAVEGIAFGAIVAVFTPWQLAALAGWCFAALVLLLWIMGEIRQADAARTREWAGPEAHSHRGAGIVITVTAVVSLVGMALGLVKARQVGQPWEEVLLTVASVFTVALSWCVVHTMYGLRYAHLYYRGQTGGIDFHDVGPPDYRDFMYLAFTIGMSFAVSDPDINDRTIRRAVTEHALVSYLFGAVIVGLTINVMAGFIR